MSATDAVLVVVAALYILPLVVCICVACMTERRRHSSVWVILCDERKGPAIVEFAGSATAARVVECSYWRSGSDCRQSCANRFRARQAVHELT
jgi:hypothetical protein